MTVHFPFTFVKISRFAERFWLRDLKQDDKGTWTGVVDNMLSEAPYRYGQRIEFSDDETIDLCHKT